MKQKKKEKTEFFFSLYFYLLILSGTFLANTLFATSDFCLSSKEKKKLIKIFSENWEMCELTEV